MTLSTRDLPLSLRSPLLSTPVPPRGARGCSCRAGCADDRARKAAAAR